jgi:hypothetical protein
LGGAVKVAGRKKLKMMLLTLSFDVVSIVVHDQGRSPEGLLYYCIVMFDIVVNHGSAHDSKW